jgi:hypothetical protein
MQSLSGSEKCLSGFNKSTECHGLGCWEVPEWIFFSRNLWELLLFVFLLWIVYALLLWTKYLLQESEADSRAKYTWLVGKTDRKRKGNWIVRARSAWIISSDTRLGSVWIISWVGMLRWVLWADMPNCDLLNNLMGAMLYVFSSGLMIWGAWRVLNE